MKASQQFTQVVLIAIVLAIVSATGVAQERQRPEPPKQTESRRGGLPRGEQDSIPPSQEPEQDLDPGQDDSSRRREGGIPRSEVEENRAQEQEGTEEGLPEMRSEPQGRAVEPYVLPRERRHWRLGVYAYNTDTGVIITRVLPRSSAALAGLEAGDRIVSVDGYQVGWIHDRLYPLGEELQRAAGRRGGVLLLVQNVRDQGLLNIPVRLDRLR